MDFNANELWALEFVDPFLCSVSSDILCLNLFKTKKIAAVSYKTGEFIWTNDLSNFVKTGIVYQPSSMVCYNGKQYLDLKSSNRNGILTLDLYSGTENWFYPGNIGFIKSDLSNIYAAKSSNILCKIDPLCDEVSEWHVDDLIKKNGFQTISDTRCAAEGGLIYFTQTIGDVRAKLGILDTREKKFVWKYEFERKHGGIGSIKVKKGRVFVHTQDQMLHVFEPIQTSL